MLFAKECALFQRDLLIFLHDLLATEPVAGGRLHRLVGSLSSALSKVERGRGARSESESDIV